MKIDYLDLRTINNKYADDIADETKKVILSGQYLNSPAVYRFETLWARHTQCKHCVSTANGLDALTAILVGMKKLYHWKDKDQVIVSANTFIASFEAITRANLTPIPCDVDAYTYLINPELIARLITQNTVAIMPVHLYGRICNMDSIYDIAQNYNLKVIVDACQAHDICKSKLLGDAAAFSFYPGKNLGALGDGGCVCTNDEELATNVRTICNYGAKIKYIHNILGFNSRLDAMQAVALNVKLQYLEQETKQRQQIALNYNHSINNDLLTLPFINDNQAVSNWHIYPILYEQRDRLQTYLRQNGISTLIHYPIPPHKQHAYANLNYLSLPVTEKICATELSIPLNPSLTIEQQQYIISTLNNFY